MAKEKLDKEAQVNQHPNKIGIREGIGYMLGDGGNLFVLTYVSSYLKVFYTDILKISTQKVANLFLFTRLWDAINDPMWGTIVAKKKPSKDGKYRPYLKLLAVPLALSQILCFLDVSLSLSEANTLVFAYVTYITEEGFLISPCYSLELCNILIRSQKYLSTLVTNY